MEVSEMLNRELKFPERGSQEYPILLSLAGQASV